MRRLNKGNDRHHLQRAQGAGVDFVRFALLSGLMAPSFAGIGRNPPPPDSILQILLVDGATQEVVGLDEPGDEFVKTDLEDFLGLRAGEPRHDLVGLFL